MASNHLGPDAHLGPVLSFAIKIFGINGTKLVEDEPDSNTFDLVPKNNPTSSPRRSALSVHPGDWQRLGQVPCARQGRVPRALD
jgi:hypothetical protein